MIEVPAVADMDDEIFSRHLHKRHRRDVLVKLADMRVRRTYEALHRYRHRHGSFDHEHEGDGE
jgi:hypothetical protein